MHASFCISLTCIRESVCIKSSAFTFSYACFFLHFSYMYLRVCPQSVLFDVLEFKIVGVYAAQSVA